MFHRRRSAFSLVEVVLVVAIIAALVSLLLPAVSSAREAARRNSCVDNLRQATLAILNYESATRRFPTGVSGPNTTVPGFEGAAPASSGDKADGYSWVVRILPYMEDVELFDEISAATRRFSVQAFDRRVRLRDGAHPSVRPAPMLCPSFAGPAFARARVLSAEAIRGGNSKTGTYIAISAACVDQNGKYLEQDPRFGGVIVSQATSPKGLKIREVRDGLSKTLLLTESKHEVYSSWYSGVCSVTTALRPDINVTRVGKDVGMLNDGFNDAPQESTGLQYGRSVEELRPVAEVPWYSTQLPGGEPWDWAQSSNHDNGVVYHAFADGRVKPISPSIDGGTYLRAVSRGGGEPIDPKSL